MSLVVQYSHLPGDPGPAARVTAKIAAAIAPTTIISAPCRVIWNNQKLLTSEGHQQILTRQAALPDVPLVCTRVTPGPPRPHAREQNELTSPPSMSLPPPWQWRRSGRGSGSDKYCFVSDSLQPHTSHLFSSGNCRFSFLFFFTLVKRK